MPAYAVVVTMVIAAQRVPPCSVHRPAMNDPVGDTIVPGRDSEANRSMRVDSLYPSFPIADSSWAGTALTRRLGNSMGYYGCDRRPRKPVLYQNYPNPFQESTAVAFYLPTALRVRIVVYDILGREVITLVDDVPVGGDYEVTWDGRDGIGNLVPSGVYFCRMIAGWTVYSIKLVCAR